MLGGISELEGDDPDAGCLGNRSFNCLLKSSWFCLSNVCTFPLKSSGLATCTVRLTGGAIVDLSALDGDWKPNGWASTHPVKPNAMTYNKYLNMLLLQCS